MNKIQYDGPGELWISDISDARTEDKSKFDRVITVCQDSIEDNVSSDTAYSFYCMSDGVADSYGGSSDYDIFEEVADELHDALSDGETVLIHCHVGQSRSVSVSIAALGRLLDKRRSEAYNLVRRYRPLARPEQKLFGHASTYIETDS